LTPSVGAELIATPGGAEAVVEQDLREHAAGRVADQDRRRVERADDASRCSMICGTVTPRSATGRR
jgi:hypothetical protein